MKAKLINFDLKRKDRVPHTTDGTLVSIKNENSDRNFIDNITRMNNWGFCKYPIMYKAYDEFAEFLSIPKANFIFGLGSDSLLKDLFLVLDYKKIQMLSHSYELAVLYNQLFCKDIVFNDFFFSNGQFRLQSSIQDLGGDVLYLVDPHCPTGFKLSTDDIINLAKSFRYIILDQAYTNPLTIDKALYNMHNIIIVKTFSKLGGVPGLRLGYCACRDQDVINKLKIVKPLYELSTPSEDYLRWIIKTPRTLEYHIKECYDTFEYLKPKTAFAIHCANFALVQPSHLFNGKHYSICGESFSRVTLTNRYNADMLLL